MSLRTEIIKRPVVTTIEVLANPLISKKNHFVTGYVHKPYPPIYLNLANRGIRSIEYSSAHQMYFIIAGSISGEGNSSIYSWSGSIKTNPKTIMTFSKLNPEAIAPIKDSKQLYVLSDDGNVKHQVKSNETNDKLIDGASSCKSLKDYNKKRFRVISLNPKKIPNKSGDF